MRLLLFNHLLLINLAHARYFIGAQQQIFNHEKPSSNSLLDLHKALVEHESITGNEQGITRWLVSYLNDQNFSVETQVVTPATSSKDARQNILAYVGKERTTRTLITSHLDVVPPYWPYERRGDEIWGRGTVDAKGCVATQITAVKELLAAGRIGEGDVAMLFVVGEEEGGDGAKKANDLLLRWDTVIFGEPTELKLASGHKGILGVEIRAKGKAGHSGYPQLGKNANSMLISALYSLQHVKLPQSEKYGNTTLNIGRIEGGVAANVIAEDASAKIAIRIADGTPATVEDLIVDAIHKTGEELEVVFTQGYGPVYIDSDVEGFETIVVNYGTDIPNLKENISGIFTGQDLFQQLIQTMNT